MKHPKKLESLYDKSLRTNQAGSKTVNEELNSFLKVDLQRRKNSTNYDINLTKSNILMKAEKVEKEENEKILDALSGVVPQQYNNLSYIPKRNIKFTPGNLMSYPNQSMKKFNSENEKGVINTAPFNIQNIHNNIISSSSNNNNSDFDYLSFKTNFILKFAKNVETYEKINKYFDNNISENNKKVITECFSKIKSLTDKKDRILFDYMTITSSSALGTHNNNLQNWKDCTTLFYEFELYWQKLTETILKELKVSKDNNIQLSKKVNDQENIIIVKDNEITYLNNYISKNDINYKSIVKKKRMKDVNEIKNDFEKKEKLNILNVFRLKDEIKDLTVLLDKDKEYYNKYNESLELINDKKKEIDEMRVKFNQDLEDKKLRIAYLNNEKHELNLKVEFYFLFLLD